MGNGNCRGCDERGRGVDGRHLGAMESCAARTATPQSDLLAADGNSGTTLRNAEPLTADCVRAWIRLEDEVSARTPEPRSPHAILGSRPAPDAAHSAPRHACGARSATTRPQRRSSLPDRPRTIRRHPPSGRPRVRSCSRRRVRRRLLLALLSEARDVAEGERRVVAHQVARQRRTGSRHRSRPAGRWLASRSDLGARGARPCRHARRESGQETARAASSRIRSR